MKHILLILLVLFIIGCKTSKVAVNDNSTLKEEIATVTEESADSIIINKEEQISEDIVEKEIVTDNSIIVFKDSGGTYDVLTGVATNVLYVKLDKESEQLKQELTQWKEKYNEVNEKLKVVKDSVSNIVIENDIEYSEEISAEQTWHWWFVIGALTMFILIVVLRKIPQTSWILSWL